MKMTEAMSAQVSVYTLGSQDLSRAVSQTLDTFRERGLTITPGSMSSIVVGDVDAVFDSMKEAYISLARQGPCVVVATFSNACPVK